MDLVWPNAEMVEKLNDIAACEGEPHGRNPRTDLEGALARPRGPFSRLPRRGEIAPVQCGSAICC